MNRITVEGISAYGYHGCMKEEEKIGQKYQVDVILDMDFMLAARMDDLSETLDYVYVNKVVIEEMGVRSKLIETVTLRIAERLKNDIRVIRVEVKVCKPTPPINGDVERVCTIVTL